MRSALLLISVLLANHGYACSPPPSLLYVQVPVLNKIVNSHEVFKAIQNLGGKDIQNISHAGGIYTLSASNGCSLKVRAKYDPPTHVGMCPTLVGLELDAGTCP